MFGRLKRHFFCPRQVERPGSLPPACFWVAANLAMPVFNLSCLSPVRRRDLFLASIECYERDLGKRPLNSHNQ